MDTSPTISETMDDFIHVIKGSKMPGTARMYRVALNKFKEAMVVHHFDPDHSPTKDLPEEAIAWLLEITKSLSDRTEDLYTVAAKEFYKYIEGENIRPVNHSRIFNLLRQRKRRVGRRLPPFNEDGIGKLVEYAETLKLAPVETDADRLINLRDRALILALADTGLRIHEACKLKRGDISDSMSAIIIGKGNKEAVVRFSRRSIDAIGDYLKARTPLLDGLTGKPLKSLPLFTRHDKGASKKNPQTIVTKTGWKIITERAKECLGEEDAATITPHSLRHYFVTKVVKRTNNLRLAKDLARHENMQITQLYVHYSDEELDAAYDKIFG